MSSRGQITGIYLVVTWLGLWWSWRLFWWSLFLLKYKFWAWAIYNHFMVFDTDFEFSRIILIGINQFAQWFYFETQLKYDFNKWTGFSWLILYELYQMSHKNWLRNTFERSAYSPGSSKIAFPLKSKSAQRTHGRCPSTWKCSFYPNW